MMDESVTWGQVMELGMMVGFLACSFNAAMWTLYAVHSDGHRAVWAIGVGMWLVCAASFALRWVPT